MTENGSCSEYIIHHSSPVLFFRVVLSDYNQRIYEQLPTLARKRFNWQNFGVVQDPRQKAVLYRVRPLVYLVQHCLHRLAATLQRFRLKSFLVPTEVPETEYMQSRCAYTDVQSCPIKFSEILCM